MDNTFWELVIFVGRLLFVFLFIGSAIGHLTQTDAMAGYAESRGVTAPPPKLAVQISGIAFLAAGVSILLGIWGDIGSLGLAVLLVITAVMMHAFWKETDPMAKQMEMVAFNKDIALAGAALFLWVYFHFDLVPWTITGPLFDAY
ncbi:putative oxidoreductase [Marmoricola sp. OAE513]|uniref:DoxX family protein n=1 Tax=Marmoricola sp. OAE513 TaxID=2817894 RepID=UPI001AE90A05